MRKFVDLRCYISTIVAVLLVSTLYAGNSAGENSSQVQDSIVRSSSIYFEFDVSSKIDSMNVLELGNLVFWIKGNKDARINICGWADHIGSNDYNKLLSERRAVTAKNYLMKKGVEGERIHYIGMGIDHDSPSDIIARRSTIMAVLDVEKVNEPAEKSVQKRTQNAREAVVYDYHSGSAPVSEPAEAKERDCGDFSIRTNLLYLAATSFNLGFEYIPANSNIGLILNGGYAPFGGDGWKRNLGAAFLSPEIRYYFGQERHWFAGVEFLAGLYNYKLCDTGYQGNVYAGGFTGGYRMELSKNFDMDFSLGLGYGKLEYDKYYHNGKGNVLIENKIKKNTFMPIQAGVSLIWKIF